jgi:hypothetical protein
MAVKLHTTKTTVGSVLPDAYSIVEGLRDECQEQYDNMPEGLQNGDKGQILSTAVDELGRSCDEAPWDGDVPDAVLNLAVEYGSNRRKNQTRQDRLDEAVRMLDAALGALLEFADGSEGTEDERSAAGELHSTIEEHKGEFEEASFS